MKKLWFVLLAVMVLVSCAPNKAATPTYQSPVLATLNSTDTEIAAPTATVVPTATDIFTSQVEAAWPAYSVLIDGAMSQVFNDKIESPWLNPVLVTPVSIDSAHNHCNLMKFWGNYIPVPESVPANCKPGTNPADDYFGIESTPLQVKGADNFILKVFPFRPLANCANENGCILLSTATGAYYGMYIGDWKVVAYCQKPDKATSISSTDWQPYLKKPVSMWIKNGDNLIEIVANQDSWFSFGWTNGSGWNESFKFCPDN
jgi:hypothetical protein